MTRRGTALLLVLLAGLLGLLWAQRDARAPAAPAPPLLEGPPSQVGRIEVEQEDTRLAAVQVDGRWADADGRLWPGSAPTDLIATLGTLRPVMIVDPDPRDPADYGLGPGAERLRVTANDGRPLVGLDLGDRNPSATGLYARQVGHREVLLLGAVLRWELQKLRRSAPAR